MPFTPRTARPAGSGRIAVLALAVVLVSLSASPAAEARKRKSRRSDDRKPRVVEIDEFDDTDALKEAIREARREGAGTVRVVVRSRAVQGPAALRAPGVVSPESTGTGYRPVDVPVTDPSFDGFPSSFHAEPSIAAQGDQVLCAFNDGGADVSSPNPAEVSNSDGFSISTDGGATFHDQGKRSPASGFTSFNGDNVVAAGPDGDFYYLSDGGRDGAPFSAMALSRSTDGGRTWARATSPSAGVTSQVPDGFFDKGWLAVDRSSGPTRGNVYVTWSDFGTGVTDLYVARSTDRGQTWAAQKLDRFVHPIAVTYVQVASNGWVYAGEQDEGDVVDGFFSGTNYVRVSTDGGLGWSALRPAGGYRTVGNTLARRLCGDPGFFGGLVRYLNGPIEADSSLRIAVDPSDPAGRTVFVTTQAIPKDRPGDDSDVFVWKSTDAGLSWTEPKRVNDDRTTTDQFMPDLWIAPDGTIGVMWLDRRNDPRGNWSLEAWMAISRDHGETWGCSFPVSSRAFPPVGRCQMSDYDAVFADDSAFHLAWGDGRQVDAQAQQTFAIFAAKVPLAGAGPLLSVERAEEEAPGVVALRVRNDGGEAANGLTATLAVDGAPSPVIVPFPVVASCHGTVDVRIPVALPATATGFVTGSLELGGPKGTVRFPLVVARRDSGPVGTLLATDFEGASLPFTPQPGSLWHVTSGCAATAPGHSGTKVAYFGRDGVCDYAVTSGGNAVRTFGALTAAPVTLPSGVSTLRFREWAGLSARWGSDYAGVQISTDAGASFENLWGYGRMSRATLDPSIALEDGLGRPTWHDAEADLTPWAGRTVVLRFFFNAVGKPFGGYAVDDVRVVAAASVATGTGTCASPFQIEPRGGGVATVAAASDLAPSAVAGEMPGCAPPPERVLWFAFTPPVTGTYRFSTCSSGVSTSLAVFRGSCGAPEPAGSSCLAASPCELPVVPPSLDVAATAGVPLRIGIGLAGSSAPGRVSLSVAPRVAREVIPIVLDVPTATTRFTTQLALTNRSSAEVAASLAYTASIGTRAGSGTVSLSLPAGRQIVFDDAIEFLRGKGLSIPASGSQGGSLAVTFDGAEPADVGATARTLARTVAPQPVGSASLAYPGLPQGAAFDGAPLAIHGLRRSAADRSKVAVFNTSTTPVTLRVTAFSGAADGRRQVYRAAEELAPGAWLQYDGLLDETGISNGWVTVERVSSSGSFGAYGVVNDNATNDGSFLAPVAGAFAGSGLTVPVLVETARFRSELVLANRGATPATLELRYRESLSPAKGPGGSATLTLAPGTQLILPDAIDYLRGKGVAAGPKGAADYAGALRVTVSGALLSDVYAGARTAASSAAGGAFGLFTPPVFRGEEAARDALLPGLRADDTNRTNVAVVNAGDDGAGTVTLLLTVHDGDRGGVAAGSPIQVTLGPGEWRQPDGFFAASGVKNGWVVVDRLSGSAPWFAYAVVNDGAAPGRRTDDGAYIPMRLAPPGI